MNTLLMPLFATLFLAASTAPLISLVVWLIVFVFVVWLVFLIVGVLPIPDPYKTIVVALVALLLLLILVSQLGLL